MSPEALRTHGRRVVDWIAEYLRSVGNYPVLARVKPGDLTAQLPAMGPEQGEAMETILADFERLIPPAITHWNHPRFLAYFAITGSPPGILAKMLTAALNVNGMLWKSSPAATELEAVTLGWLRQWLGLADTFFGITYDTASTASMHAIAAARQKSAPESRTTGMRGNLTVYCSGQAHSSIDKAVITLGFGLDNLRKIGVDDKFRMDAAGLEQAIEADKAAGRLPCCIVATVGTTAVAAVDPVREIAGIAERHGVWLHVDAAYGGAAAITGQRRHVLDGANGADSIVVNPHKWLQTPVDSSALYTRRPDALRAAFSLVPEYLRTDDEPGVVNLMDYGMQLGRRFRALELWFVMRYYGREGLAAIIDRHCSQAAEFASWVESDSRFQLCAPVLFSLVCFRYRGNESVTRRILEGVNSSGLAFLSHTSIGGELAIRVAIGNAATTAGDLRRVWEKVVELAA
jgi:aromatic-L-amino-acid decarboxylase